MLVHNVRNAPDPTRLIDREIAGAQRLIVALRAIPPDDEVPPHVHDNEEQAYVVLSGRGLVRVGDEERVLGPMDAVYIPPGTEHSVKNMGAEGFRYVYAVAITS